MEKLNEQEVSLLKKWSDLSNNSDLQKIWKVNSNQFFLSLIEIGTITKFRDMGLISYIKPHIYEFTDLGKLTVGRLKEPCFICHGTGIDEGYTCTTCNGEGWG